MAHPPVQRLAANRATRRHRACCQILAIGAVCACVMSSCSGSDESATDETGGSWALGGSQGIGGSVTTGGSSAGSPPASGGSPHYFEWRVESRTSDPTDDGQVDVEIRFWTPEDVELYDNVWLYYWYSDETGQTGTAELMRNHISYADGTDTMDSLCVYASMPHGGPAGRRYVRYYFDRFAGTLAAGDFVTFRAAFYGLYNEERVFDETNDWSHPAGNTWTAAPHITLHHYNSDAGVSELVWGEEPPE